MAESSASFAEKVKEVEELKNTRASVSPSLVKTKEKFASAVISAAETTEVMSALPPELRLVASER